MAEIVSVYKPLGMTMGEMISQTRQLMPALAEAKLSFLGRLDPLAEGLVLVGVEADSSFREKLLGLPKKYRFKVWFGLATDTGDILGRIVKTSFDADRTQVETTISEALPALRGKRQQLYPWYSSKPVEGRPLWQWAREGRQAEVTRPVKTVTVLELKAASRLESLTVKEVVVEALAKVKLVRGDFRQNEISQDWQALLEKNGSEQVLAQSFEVMGSSGLYVRALAEEIGSRVGKTAVCAGIIRTAIGKYNVSNAQTLPIE